MILQLIIAALLAFALGGPYFMGKSQVVDYVLALDCSMSMQAVETGTSRFEKAKKDMMMLVEEAAPDSSFSLVLLTEEPSLVISSTQEKQKVLQLIRNAEVTNGGVDWVGSKGILEGEKKALGGEILLFTDDYGHLSEVSLLEQVYNEQGSNTALTTLSYTEEEDRLSVLAKVAQWGQMQEEKTITLYADGVAVDIKSILPTDGETMDIVFQGVPNETRSLMVRLFPEDALVADDVLFEGIHGGQTQRVLLVTEGNIFLEKALSLMEQVELYKATPDNAVDLSGYSLYVFDGFLPEMLPKDGAIMAFQPPDGGASLLGIGGEKEISTQVRGTSELADVENLTFDVEKATPLTLDWGKPLLRAGTDTLGVLGEMGGRKIAVFGFDLHDSDLPLKAGFPILLYRLLEWYFPQGDGGISGEIAGEIIDFTLTPQTQKAFVVLPDGGEVTIAPPFPPKTFMETGETGLYTLVEEDGTGQRTERVFGVNGKTQGESDLQRRGALTQTQEVETKTIATGKSLRNLLLLLLLAVLMWEWRVNCREH